MALVQRKTRQQTKLWLLLNIVLVVVVVVYRLISSGRVRPLYVVGPDNLSLYERFVEYFSVYPSTYVKIPDGILGLYGRFKKQQLVIRSENEFKALLKSSIIVGKVLMNNRRDCFSSLCYETDLRTEVSTDEQILSKLETIYRSVIDFLLTTVKYPKKKHRTPFKFDWYHFSVTLPMLYSQAMVLLCNPTLASAIIEFLPQPNVSLGYTRTLSNVVQMAIPYLCAQCFLHMPLANLDDFTRAYMLHRNRRATVKYALRKLSPRTVQTFSADVDTNNNEIDMDGWTKRQERFLLSTSSDILTLLTNFRHSRVFKDSIELTILPIDDSGIPANGLDGEGGFLFHNGLRSYNYLLAMFESYIFYQIMYRSIDCTIRGKLDWIARILHFGHTAVHPSIVTRFGVFSEFNRGIWSYVRLFDQKVWNGPTTEISSLLELHRNPEKQKTGIFLFRRASFVSAIFKNWSLQLMLPRKDIAFGEVDSINTQIVHQSALSKIMLMKSVLEESNLLKPGDMEYPGNLWIYSVEHKADYGTKCMFFSECKNNRYGYFDLEGFPLGSHPEEDALSRCVFISFARLKVIEFNLAYTELVFISQYGILVAYLDIDTIRNASGNFKCCVHRWPGVRASYTTFTRNDRRATLADEAFVDGETVYTDPVPLRDLHTDPKSVKPIVVEVQESIVYTNVIAGDKTLDATVSHGYISPKDKGTIDIQIPIPEQDVIFTLSIRNYNVTVNGNEL